MLKAFRRCPPLSHLSSGIWQFLVLLLVLLVREIHFKPMLNAVRKQYIFLWQIPIIQLCAEMWRGINKALGWKREGAPCLDLLSCMHVPSRLHFSLSLKCIGSEKKPNMVLWWKEAQSEPSTPTCGLDLPINPTGRSKPGRRREMIQGCCLMILQRGSASREMASHCAECCTQG